MALGLVHIYTGDGKGKTTAAIGQGIRCAGNGKKVIMVQFLKSGKSGELNLCERIKDSFEIVRFDKTAGFFWQLDDAQKDEVKKNVTRSLQYIEKVMKSNSCDLLILDELIGVIKNGLIDVQEMTALLQNKPMAMELILTGRQAPDYLIARADYVTEMVPIKHPFEQGIPAREGIEF
ncbi:MAG: cob(I)yrinic acid a,c-diamide adenosyltransferase [Hyphomonadaceae bacterium]|nr:cob(I)yrinic acid a,c-diamide adenosyltransferase [Clostridia bacterium]